MKRFLLAAIASMTIATLGLLDTPALARPPRLRRQWPQRDRVEKPERNRDRGVSSPALNQVSDLEWAVYDEVNQYRLKQGLSALKLDRRLIAQARNHSQAMASRRVPVGHQGFDRRVKQISRAIPSRRVSENVALLLGQNNLPGRALREWLKSPKHRAAIEDRHHLTGVGIVQRGGGTYITQIFVRRR